MIIFAVDDTAYRLLKEWAYNNSDLVIRFCDDITPRFKNARILLQKSDKPPIDIHYRVDLNKIAYFYLPSVGKQQIRFSVNNDLRSERHYNITSYFEEIATFYIDIADVFLRLNAFLLNGSISTDAKKAFEKKTLLDFKKEYYFTLRKKKGQCVLDICDVEKEDGVYIVR
ncbi:hypothetical protein [Ruminococcus sp. NK3A76]|uniref:hypothetical protein n=1 Tax=Ruminococcus sp. NK3A76 TaxID=877411 RepID=UPI0004907229|nr:hypothetical protein [Ruminococcus sp. NK3A76]